MTGVTNTLLTEKAVRLAEDDKMRLADRTQRETEELSESLLSASSDNTQENLKDEKDELELIVTQCERDIRNIGKSLLILYQRQTLSAFRK